MTMPFTNIIIYDIFDLGILGNVVGKYGVE